MTAVPNVHDLMSSWGLVILTREGAGYKPKHPLGTNRKSNSK